MSKLLDQYVGHVRFLRVLTLGDAGARKAALTGMKAIHAAFRKRDADAAATAMHKHLEAAKQLPGRSHRPDRKGKGRRSHRAPAPTADTARAAPRARSVADPPTSAAHHDFLKETDPP
jgi:hypothetical protein